MVYVFLLTLLLEQVSSLRHPLRCYHYIDIRKSWHDAREYCQANYDDIAILDSAEDAQLLSKPVGTESFYAWIGLLDDPAHWRPHMGNSINSWVWSATGKHSLTGYHNFKAAQPNNYASTEMCVIMDSVSTWQDVACKDLRSFVCFTESGSGVSYTYISTKQRWLDAQAYCRHHHTDLVTIEDNATNTQIFNVNPATSIWIGLSRKPWHWADESPLTFSNWQQGAPFNRGIQYCVTEDDEHKWKDVGCQNLNRFFCHEENLLINKVKVNFQSSAHLTDSDVQIQILQKLKAELRAHGHNVSKLGWSIKPLIRK